MNNKDSRMIWESYVVQEREYGPSGQASFNPDDFEITEVYSFNEWPAQDNNPYNDIVATIQRGSRLTNESDGYVVFYAARAGTETYEQWTDPSIAIGFEISAVEEERSLVPMTPAVFVDQDGSGDKSSVSPQIVTHLLSRDQNRIFDELSELNQQY